jgi:glycosyltransferase involved in cell wall biosynthesis
VTAIVPLYNKRETVAEAIDSALAQTRLPDEIVIVDDGSTDGSGDLVQDRYGHNSRIRLIRQANQGVSAARNAAIRASRSPLLAFLDADDRWLPQKLERQLAILQRQPECMLVFAAAELCQERSGVTWLEGHDVRRESYLQDFFRERHLPVCSGVVVRRAALDDVGVFDESLRMGEDHDLWLRVMLRFDFAHCLEPVVWYRCCRSQTLASVERDFRGNDAYFAKHRHTFGRGIRGHATWRAAYSCVLRRHAQWYFQHGEGRKALHKSLRASLLWPFHNPLPLAKSGAEYFLGRRAYRGVVQALRRLSGRSTGAQSHD